MNIEEIKNYRLNLELIFKLPKDDKKIIMDLFRSLEDSIARLDSSAFGISFGNTTSNVILAEVLFNTLKNNNYLQTLRDENLEKLIR